MMIQTSRSGTNVNVIVRYYDGIRRAVGTIGGESASARPTEQDPTRFRPAFTLPDIDDAWLDYFSPATATILRLRPYGAVNLYLLDLMQHPAVQTAKTFASLLMVARAVRHIRETGKGIVILTPSSGNKGIALRDAVERAIARGLVSKEQLRIVVIVPADSLAKLRRSELSASPALRALNPVFVYEGEQPSAVKSIARRFVDRYAETLDKQLGLHVWYSLDLDNYRPADATRAFLEHDMLPISGPPRARAHAHAVSSAYGLLGYSLGRRVLHTDGVVAEDAHPQMLLVQHLGTPDMVVHGAFGSFDRSHVPAYHFDPGSGLYEQSSDHRFPHKTHDPEELLDTTFYTSAPPTCAEIERIMARFGGAGIVVSRYECMARYDHIRDMMSDAGVNVPRDSGLVREWSLLMALTGTMNAIDRRLIHGVSDIVIHGTGFYTALDYSPMSRDDVHVASSEDDIARALFGGLAAYASP